MAMASSLVVWFVCLWLSVERLNAGGVCKREKMFNANVFLYNKWILRIEDWTRAQSRSWTGAMSPCFDVYSGMGRDALMQYDVLSQTQFGTLFCQPYCHLNFRATMNAKFEGGFQAIQCGPRRLPPNWHRDNSEKVLITKINCSDLNFPITDAERQLPLDLNIDSYNYVADKYFERVEEPIEMLEYLADNFNLDNVRINFALDKHKLEKNETYDVFRPFSNARGLQLFCDIWGFSATAQLVSALSEYRNLRAINIVLVLEAHLVLESLIERNNLRSVSLRRTFMTKWMPLEMPDLLMLSIVDQDTLNLTIEEVDKHFSNYEQLEIFVLGRTATKEIGSKFLAKSTNLRYLDLTGNMIESIAADAFSHMVKLRALLLNCNQFVSIPSTLFHSLTKLQVLDIRGSVSKALTSSLFMEKTAIHDSTRSVGMATCAIRGGPGLQVSGGLGALSADQFKGLKSLERLELAYHPQVTVDRALLAPLANNLKFLALADVGLTDLSSLGLDKFCKLTALVADDNPLGTNEKWLTYETAVNLHNLKFFSMDNTSSPSITGPLYLVSKNSDYMRTMLEQQLVLSTSLVKGNPSHQNECSKTIWQSFEVNKELGMEGDCAKQYSDMKSQLATWLPRRFEQKYIKCPIMGSGAGIGGVGGWVAVVAAFVACYLAGKGWNV